MTIACNSGVLDVQDPRAKLLEWMDQLGFKKGGELSILKEITQFNSMKQFPGCGPDSVQYIY